MGFLLVFNSWELRHSSFVFFAVKTPSPTIGIAFNSFRHIVGSIFQL
ncbi:hypothetical protein C943_04517 [Mariniradius saccharolyticus AK6]|uniref:Uncharacterized protein n=1 Tax=Mariniradius saccharolyticus AK6 TaxID=1239962 RepID=M7XGF7_9BACT|nr:hypothetical protein C943_04517 [Mariniradius saccharolyticus AK6]